MFFKPFHGFRALRGFAAVLATVLATDDRVPCVLIVNHRVVDWIDGLYPLARLLYANSAGRVPLAPNAVPRDTQPEDIRLVPYGCTTVRIAGFPWVRNERNPRGD